MCSGLQNMAVRLGFEPRMVLPISVFEADAFNRTRPPHRFKNLERGVGVEPTTQVLQTRR